MFTLLRALCGAVETVPARRRSRAIAVLLASLLAAGCSLLPGTDGLSEAVPGGLDGFMRRRDIEPLDPRSHVPLVKQTLEELQKTDRLRLYSGTTYRLTEGNTLPAGWIIQSPDAWGKRATEVAAYPVDCQNCDADFRLRACVSTPDCPVGHCGALAASVVAPGQAPRRFCLGDADALVDAFYKLVVSARRVVDITTLAPAADVRFRAALRNAVTMLAISGRPVTIRAIAGDYPPKGYNAAEFLGQLMRDAARVPQSRLRVFAAVIRSCDIGQGCGALSWNHAKIVAVDGERAIVGGHNQWTPDYLASDPVHDLSMEVEGPAAGMGHRFADALWEAACSRPPSDDVNAVFVSLGARSSAGPECPRRMAVSSPRGSGSVPILAVGRLGTGIAHFFADQSLVARDLLFGAATRTLRLVQQDVAFGIAKGLDRTWPESALERMADLIARQGDVYIVLSNLEAAGPIGAYSNSVPIEAVGQKIREVVRRRSGLVEPALSALLCRRLHLASIRFGPDAAWPDGKPIGNHAKFWMVDDRVFYIGSENLYPADLQEFGYIVEDAKAAAQLRTGYWDKIWAWSRPAAVSGADAPRCIFDGK